MATNQQSEHTPVVVNGAEAPSGAAPSPAQDESRARDLAHRYHCEFLDLRNFQLNTALLRKVPVELMFRYNFVPLEERDDGLLVIALADPSRLMMVDEIGLLLGKRIKTKVATLTQINDILKKSEQSQRVLDEASEAFTLDVIREDDAGSDEQISIDRLTAEGGGLNRALQPGGLADQLLSEAGLIDRLLSEDGLADRLLSEGGVVDKLTAKHGPLEQLADVADTLARLTPGMEALEPAISTLQDAVMALTMVVNPLSNIADRIPLPGRRPRRPPSRPVPSTRIIESDE